MASRRMILKADCARLEYIHLTIRQRYLFEHLMLEADDDGILLAIYAKHNIFPFDSDITEDDVLEDLKLLALNGFIEIYTLKGEKYIYVLDWRKRQYVRSAIYEPSIHPKPKSFISKPIDAKKSKQRKYNRNVTESVTNHVTQEREVETGEVRNSLAEIRPAEDDLPFLEDGSLHPSYK